MQQDQPENTNDGNLESDSPENNENQDQTVQENDTKEQPIDKQPENNEPPVNSNIADLNTIPNEGEVNKLAESTIPDSPTKEKLKKEVSFVPISPKETPPKDGSAELTPIEKNDSTKNKIDLTTLSPNNQEPEANFIKGKSEIKDTALAQIQDLNKTKNTDDQNLDLDFEEDDDMPGYNYFKNSPIDISNIEDFLIKDINGASLVHFISFFHDSGVLNRIYLRAKQTITSEREKNFNEQKLIDQFLDIENEDDEDKAFDKIQAIGKSLQEQGGGLSKTTNDKPTNPNAKQELLNAIDVPMKAIKQCSTFCNRCSKSILCKFCDGDSNKKSNGVANPDELNNTDKKDASNSDSKKDENQFCQIFCGTCKNYLICNCTVKKDANGTPITDETENFSKLDKNFNKIEKKTKQDSNFEKKTDSCCSNFCSSLLFILSCGCWDVHDGDSELSDSETNQKKINQIFFKNLFTYKQIFDIRDNYGQNPLLFACIGAGSNKRRLSLIKELIQVDAVDVNAYNNKTCWNSAHWQSFHNDFESQKLLRTQKLELYYPDYKGYFPIDIAGIMGNLEIVKFIIQQILQEQKLWEEENKPLINLATPHPQDNPPNQTQQMKPLIGMEDPQKKYRYIKFPGRCLDGDYLWYHMLYWACRYGWQNYIEEIFNVKPLLIPEMPIKSLDNTTCFHAVCYNNNDQILKILFEKAAKLHKDIYMKSVVFIDEQTEDWNLQSNQFLCIVDEDQELYQEKFFDKLEDMHKWLCKYQTTIYEKYYNVSDEVKANMFLKMWESYDQEINSPLHISCFYGAVNCLRIFAGWGGNFESENKNGWKPYELVQIPAVEKFFQEFFEQIVKTANTGELSYFPKNILDEAHMEDQWDSNYHMTGGGQNTSDLFTKTFDRMYLDKYKEYADNIAINAERTNMPDLIFKVGYSAKKTEAEKVKLFDRLDYYIDLFKRNNFDVSLMSSIDKGCYYILLELPVDYTEIYAEKLGFETKLLRYNFHKKFVRENRFEFEPFRSRAKHEIIHEYLSNILKIDNLVKKGLFQDYYWGSVSSGLSKVSKYWINEYFSSFFSTTWQMTHGGKNVLYTKLSKIYVYFGERTIFYFAWLCFLWAMLFIPAIFGLIAEIYNAVNDSTMNFLLFLYILILSLSVQLSIKLWKRKEWEINTQLGISQFKNQELLSQQTSENFINTNPKFTYYNIVNLFLRSQTIKGYKPLPACFFISIIIFICLLIGCICLLILILESIHSSWNGQNPSSNFGWWLKGFVYSLTMLLFDYPYNKFITWIVSNINSRSYKKNDTVYIVVKTWYECVACYSYGFYYAFIMKLMNSQDLQLTSQCRWIIIGNMTINVLFKFLLYDWLVLIKSSRMTSNYLEKISEESKLQVQSSNEAIQEKRIELWRRAYISLNEKKAEMQPQPVISDMVDIESMKNKTINLDRLFVKILIIYGYGLFFASYVPGTFFIILIILLIKYRIDISMCLFYTRRRPMYKDYGLGYFEGLWQIFTIIGIAANFIYMVIESRIYQFSTGLFGNAILATAFIAVFCENIILIIYSIIDFMINNKPKWVIELERRMVLISDDLNEKYESFRRKGKIKFMENKINNLHTDFEKHKETTDKQLENYKNVIDLNQDQLKRLKDDKEYSEFYFENKMESLKYEYKVILDKWNLTAYLLVEKRIMNKRCVNVGLEARFVMCEECHKKRAMQACMRCDELYCLQCFSTFHSEMKLESHEPINQLLHKLDKTEEAYVSTNTASNQLAQTKNSSLDLAGAKMVQELQPEKYSIYIQKDKLSVLIDDVKNQFGEEKFKEDKKCFYEWRKVELCQFPETEQAIQQYPELKIAYNALMKGYKDYVGYKKQVDVKADQTGKKEQLENIINFDTAFQLDCIENCFNKLANIFNCEEMLIMNRVFYYCWRVSNGIFYYKDFTRSLCQIKNENDKDSNIRIFLNFCDYQNKGVIFKDHVINILQMSFIYDLFGNLNLNEVVDKAFGGKDQMKKVEIYEVFVMDKQIRSMLDVFLS